MTIPYGKITIHQCRYGMFGIELKIRNEIQKLNELKVSIWSIDWNKICWLKCKNDDHLQKATLLWKFVAFNFSSKLRWNLLGKIRKIIDRNYGSFEASSNRFQTDHSNQSELLQIFYSSKKILKSMKWIQFKC